MLVGHRKNSKLCPVRLAEAAAQEDAVDDDSVAVTTAAAAATPERVRKGDAVFAALDAIFST